MQYNNQLQLIWFFLCLEHCGARKRLSFSDDSPLSPEEEVSSQPVYGIPPSKYSAERVIKILLQAENSKICRKKPTSVCRSATYVVDVRSLRCQDDIKKDEFGIWNYSGSHPQPFKVHENYDDLIVEKCCPGVSGKNVVLLRRLHSTYPACPSFTSSELYIPPEMQLTSVHKNSVFGITV